MGTLLNILTVLIGGGLGLTFGARLPHRIRETVLHGLGLFTIAIGLQMTFDSNNMLIVLGSLLVGGMLGEWWGIDARLKDLGAWLEARAGRPESPLISGTPFASPFGGARGQAPAIAPDVERKGVPDHLSPSVSEGGDGRAGRPESPLISGTPVPDPDGRAGRPGGDEGEQAERAGRFIKGFVTASLVFCVGPLTILGSIDDGLRGDIRLLAIKSVLDGFAALAFASSLGVGVLFSTLTIAVYQGALTLLAAQAESLLTEPMIAEMTATGGLLIMGIGFSSLLELKPIRVGNFLPALAIAPLVVAALPYLEGRWCAMGMCGGS